MSESQVARHDVERALADELLAIHVDNYGKGAGSVKALISEDLIVVMLDDLELQRSEEFLIESGQGRGVIEVRGQFQQAIQTSYRAAVERATGRRVTSFASVTKLDPNYAVEIFRLGDRVQPESPSTGDAPEVGPS